MVPTPTYKMVVFDTESYAGSFERNFPAYVTGVGDDEYTDVQRALEKLIDTRGVGWFTANCTEDMTESGHQAYATIYPTPGWYNDGFGLHYKESDTTDEEALIMRDAHIDRKYGKYGKEWKVVDDYKARPLDKHEAYMSIAIFVHEFPPKEILDIMIARAKTFAMGMVSNQSFKLTGVRLLEPVYQVNTIDTIEIEAA